VRACLALGSAQQLDSAWRGVAWLCCCVAKPSAAAAAEPRKKNNLIQ